MKKNCDSSHPIRRIISSRKPFMVALKRILVVAIAFLGLAGLIFSLQSLSPQDIYRKDFIQEYLLAKAVLNGINPYIPLHELANKLMGPLPNPIFQHPSPHPPPVILLSLPFGFLTYQWAAIAWFVFELICILMSVYGILRYFEVQANALMILLCASAALAWTPFSEELAVGQLMTLNLALLVGAWLMLRTGKEIRGGILLGSAIALKLIAWPLAIFLILRKSWMAIGAIFAVLLSANAITAFVVGIQPVIDYYFKTGPLVSSLYRSYIENLSLWSIGWKIFNGTGSPVLFGINAYPLYNAPVLAGIISYFLTLILLSVGLFLAMRTSNLDNSFSMLICVSLLVSPITWNHYLILASISLAILCRQLLALDFPRVETNFALLLGFLLFIPQSTLKDAMLIFADKSLTVPGSEIVDFPVTLIILIPALAILGLIWIIRRMDQIYFCGYER